MAVRQHGWPWNLTSGHGGQEEEKGPCSRQDLLHCKTMMSPHLTTVYSIYFKGVCHEIYDLYFYPDSNPYVPLINGLKYFQLQFRFRQDTRIFKKLRPSLRVESE